MSSGTLAFTAFADKGLGVGNVQRPPSLTVAQAGKTSWKGGKIGGQAKASINLGLNGEITQTPGGRALIFGAGEFTTRFFTWGGGTYDTEAGAAIGIGADKFTGFGVVKGAGEVNNSGSVITAASVGNDQIPKSTFSFLCTFNNLTKLKISKKSVLNLTSGSAGPFQAGTATFEVDAEAFLNFTGKAKPGYEWTNLKARDVTFPGDGNIVISGLVNVVSEEGSEAIKIARLAVQGGTLRHPGCTINVSDKFYLNDGTLNGGGTGSIVVAKQTELGDQSNVKAHTSRLVTDLLVLEGSTSQINCYLLVSASAIKNQGAYNIDAGSGIWAPNFILRLPFPISVSSFENAGSILVPEGVSPVIDIWFYNVGKGNVLGDPKLIRPIKTPGSSINLLGPQARLTGTAILGDGSGGRLVGTGTVMGLVFQLSGDVAPGYGSRPGILSVASPPGIFRQADGNLDIEIGGTSAGSGFDQLNVAGITLVAGALDLSLIGSYVPNVNDSFQVFTYSSRIGTFSGISGQVFASGSKRFDLQYNATNLTLTCVSNSSPPSTPTVTSRSSSSGSTEGGVSITITGTGFDGIAAVMFGSTPANNWTRNSSTSITAVVPAHATGTVDVRVTNVTGTSSTGSGDTYTYTTGATPTVTGVSPTIGDPAGDSTYVTITGTNLAGTTGVKFGSVNVDWFVVQSSTQVLTLAPASAAGTFDITVTTYAGTSSTSSADHFTYPGTPSVTSLSASSGGTGGGTSVNITGTGFTGAQCVYFGSTLVTDFTVNSDTSLTVAAPPSDAGTIDVLVQGPNGISSPSSSTRFTFSAASAPSVSSLSASSGGTAGGTVVTITGSNFSGASLVLFGQVAAQAFVNSATQITAVAPAQGAGTVDVTVVSPTGTSAVSSADHFTYSAGSAPTVTSLSVSSGSTGGGAVVTITGTGFTDAVSVQFGSVTADSFSVLNDSTIVATAPVQGSGTIDVTVTNNAGTSSTSSSDHFTYSGLVATIALSETTVK